MSTKDKETALNKLKQWFRNTKTTGSGIKEIINLPLTIELENSLKPETPVSQRIKSLKELGDNVLINQLEDCSVQKLWDLTKDMIIPSKPAEQRQAALVFYRKLIQGQKNLSLMRAHFFSVIQNHEVPEDITYRFELLKSLTENGKNITHFEEEIGNFMLQWVTSIVEAKLTEYYLEIIVNLIKFNTAHVNDVLVGIVQNACQLSCYIDDTSTVLQCLSVLDSAICYAVFPHETLNLCIIALCRTVNKESYCQTSWKIMRNLLGSNFGHSSLLFMCHILNDHNSYDEAVLRGAVFHINMGLWGANVSNVPMFKCTPSTVLLSFLHALDSKRIIVTYEVVLSIQRLIQNCGEDLAEPSWDVICDILQSIAENIRYYEKNGLSKEHPVQKHFHDTLDSIETLIRKNNIAANIDLIYDLIEKVSEDRPESSVVELIEYRTNRITATCPQWLEALNKFIDRFYKMSNSSIRVKAVQSLMSIMEKNRAGYEEEILERIVMPHFSNIHQESDCSVRVAVAKLLVDFTLHCDTKRCVELLEIIEKLLNRPFEIFQNDGTIFTTEREIQDVIVIVEGLIQIFLIKLYHLPSSHAIRIFQLLIGHLDQNYQRSNVIECSSKIKLTIFKWMLNARANSSFHIGYPDQLTGTVVFSNYLGIDGTHQQHSVVFLQPQQTGLQQSQSSDIIPAPNFTTISIRRGCKIIVKCLESEKDWNVVHLVLKELPNIMQNKALIQGNDVDSLTRSLHKRYFDKNSIDIFTERPKSIEFLSLILTAIASLVTYHQYLDPVTQKRIVEALKSGLFIRAPVTARICVQALTLMILEMPESLVKLLPDVLLEMSKVSDTKVIAIPVLEFLSTLSRFPNHCFANFITRQHMYVFAISLPYTNPSRYDHYTVSLAHHVIAGWFLKCRLPLRRNLVNYIIAGLKSNVHMPIQENRSKPDFSPPVNEDSSNRKRSSSLTEQGSRRRTQTLTTTTARPKPEAKPVIDDALYAFHMELAETCIDFMARHTFSPYSALPKRLPTSDFLLSGGQSLTWLVDHNLITITTSGCTTSPLKNGLCDRCFTMCKSMSNQILSKTDDESPDSLQFSNKDSENKRYTKASLQHSSGTNESESSDLTSSSSSSAAVTPFQLQQAQNSRFFRQSSTDGRFSSSSGSLEALSGGSGLDNSENNGIDSPSKNTLFPPQLPNSSTPVQSEGDKPRQLCVCSCTGWAEICIRRPTGTMSWVMRIQNQISHDSFSNDFPLHDLTTLFMPSHGGGVVGGSVPFDVNKISSKQNLIKTKEKIEVKQEIRENLISPENKIIIEEIKKAFIPINDVISTVSSSSGPINIPGQKTDDANKQIEENVPTNFDEDGGFDDDDSESRSRNPVRRVNSSPEMSSNWRNPFLNQKNGQGAETVVVQANQAGYLADFKTDDGASNESDVQQKKKNFGKDMRVSCEAIPEEIAGSTPPSLTSSVTKETLNSVLISSSECYPSETNLKDNSQLIPKKQLSADDAVQLTQSVETNLTIQPITNPTLSLKLPTDTSKVTKKPPQSPAPLSPRLLARNKIAANLLSGLDGNLDNNNEVPRGRSKTISVVREHYRGNTNSNRIREHTATPTVSRSGISPSFVFLQLYHTGQNATERPLKLDTTNSKAIALLDLIPPFETHKIGVLYVGPGQCNNETEILKNRFGSVRYAEFLRNLGTLVAIKDAKEHNLFINMESDGRDGNFTYIWQDNIVQVTFHVATLMPNKDLDPHCNEKKKHIGNDFVTIVYNESGEDYNINTIKGQFNYACVVVQPIELNSNRVFVLAKADIAETVCHSEPKIVSDNSAPLLARQLALHANLASLVAQSLKTKSQSPYASNWLERLRKIKHLRNKLLKEQITDNENNTIGANVASTQDPTTSSRRSYMYDFTHYTQ